MKKMWLIALGIGVAFILLFMVCAILNIPKDEEREFERVAYSFNNENTNLTETIDENTNEKILNNENSGEVIEGEVVASDEQASINTAVSNEKTTINTNTITSTKNKLNIIPTNNVVNNQPTTEEVKVDEVVRYEEPVNEVISNNAIVNDMPTIDVQPSEEMSNEITQQETQVSAGEIISEDIKIPAGSVGVLKIDKINMYQQVVEGHTLDILKHDLGHVIDTATWKGNIGILGHNSGNAGYFSRIYELQKGDEIEYLVDGAKRKYKVSEITQIDDDDWGKLCKTEDNRITLITCVKGVPEKRYCVQAVAVK